MLRKSLKKENKDSTRHIYIHFQHFCQLEESKLSILLEII